VHDMLKSLGPHVAPWFDCVDITPGTVWSDEIDKAFTEADVFIAFIGDHQGPGQSLEIKQLKGRLFETPTYPVLSVFLPGVSEFPTDLRFFKPYQSVKAGEVTADLLKRVLRKHYPHRSPREWGGSAPC